MSSLHAVKDIISKAASELSGDDRQAAISRLMDSALSEAFIEMEKSQRDRVVAYVIDQSKFITTENAA